MQIWDETDQVLAAYPSRLEHHVRTVRQDKAPMNEVI